MTYKYNINLNLYVIDVMAHFKWSYDADVVYVTGNFTNWINHKIMQKIGNVH
jgi:hypothetical protein